MPRYLLFRLAAPIASFGTVAVGERRPTWDRPSKSQIIGLVASCLGYERQEEERQGALSRALGFAVRIDDAGQLSTDYHTTQVPPARRNRRFATRAEELGVGKTDLKTILSRREYRVGSCYTVCLWLSGESGFTLDDIAAAINEPTFVPFAGRKANALMLPMRPAIIETATIAAAFEAYDATEPETVKELWSLLKFAPRGDGLIFADADAAETHGRPIERLEERRDIPESRAKWRFGLRSEVLLAKAPRNGDTP